MTEIALAGVSRVYAGKRALDAVSFTAPSGQVTALLGASGSGKSTLLRLVAGLEPVDAGEIRLGGVRASAPGLTEPPETRRISMVFQDFALFPHLTIAQNVAFGLAKKSKTEQIAAAREWLARIGLEGRAEAYPHMLSGGEQQRVALARALAPHPRAVLLDEPFSGLDPTLRAALRETTLSALKAAGATAIFVTHDADEAMFVADQLAILKSGRLVQIGPPREVYARPASPDAAAALGPINAARTIIAGGKAATPFGAIAAPGLPEGAEVEVIVRAEALILSETGPLEARILDRRPQGPWDLVFLERGGLIWRALAPSRVGMDGPCRVSLDPAGAFVFPA